MGFFEKFATENRKAIKHPKIDIAIIDDEPLLRELLAKTITIADSDRRIMEDASMKAALDKIHDSGCEFVIADYYLDDGNGLDLHHQLTKRGWKGTYWLISNDPSKRMAIKLGVDKFYNKRDLHKLLEDVASFVSNSLPASGEDHLKSA